MTTDMFESSRRGFVKQGLGLGLGLAGSGGAMAKAIAGFQPSTLSVAELASVKALMARIIPADSEHGGAVEAGAHVYLDRALAGFHARHLPVYRRALAELGQLGVAAMQPAALDALIGRMEQGALAGTRLADGGKAFFNLIRRHTIEGFLSDPIYGGNQDFLGWQVIGFHGVQVWYPAEAQALNGRETRPQRSIADYGGSPMA
jgi:gluconate 2-dehydrogenase gamma chain